MVENWILLITASNTVIGFQNHFYLHKVGTLFIFSSYRHIHWVTISTATISLMSFCIQNINCSFAEYVICSHKYSPADVSDLCIPRETALIFCSCIFHERANIGGKYSCDTIMLYVIYQTCVFDPLMHRHQYDNKGFDRKKKEQKHRWNLATLVIDSKIRG